MTWIQKSLSLSSKKRGYHLVTDEVLKTIAADLRRFEVGICQVFIQHTSASLTLNENADPSVRVDMETILNRVVPESASYTHDDEGPDDMPGHVKASLFGASLMIPITNGRLNLGTWQGIWLCEHRNDGGSRNIVVTMNGALKNETSSSSSTASSSTAAVGVSGAGGR